MRHRPSGARRAGSAGPAHAHPPGRATAAAVKVDAQSMVFDYRVFVLTGPKVRLTAAVDTELAAVAKLRTLPEPPED